MLGYLSVLLCILCLDDENRLIVSKRFPGESLQPLLLTTADFLQHLETVEQESSNARSSDSAAIRFAGVLLKLEAQESSSGFHL